MTYEIVQVTNDLISEEEDPKLFGARRLILHTPQTIGPQKWRVQGVEEFGDVENSYEVIFVGDGIFKCSCNSCIQDNHYKNKMCSHIAACMIYTGLPCTNILPHTHNVIPSFSSVPDKPNELDGIPDRYTKWRPYQRDSIQFTLNEWNRPRKIVVLDAPVGFGKSIVAIAASTLFDEKTVYLCSTLQLQNQIAKDFPHCIPFYGRDNYSCIRYSTKELTAAHCTNSVLECPKKKECEYMRVRNAVWHGKTRLIVANYALYLTEVNGPGKLEKYTTVIMDEADTAESHLMNYVSVKLTQKQLEACKISPPRYKTKFESWLAWVEPTLNSVGLELMLIEDKIERAVGSTSGPSLELLQDKIAYSRLSSKLNIFKEAVDETWVSELDKETEWEFKPSRVNKCSHYLLDHSEKILAMSGTILSARDWGYDLGIKETISYKSVPSTFPVERRPIFVINGEPMGKKQMNSMTFFNTVNTIDNIIDKYPYDKGLIHTVNYKLSEYISEHSRHQDRIIGHGKKNREQSLKRFMNTDYPLVLISPSYTRGVDLAHNMGRFQIITKLAFPDLGNEQINKRRWTGKSGERWYLLLTMRDLCQAVGRIMRAEDDWGHTYILDARFRRFYLQMKEYFPSWFTEALNWDYYFDQEIKK